MPDADGNLQFGDVTSEDQSTWQFDFTGGKSYRLIRLHPSGSRKIIPGRGQYDAYYDVGQQSSVDRMRRTQQEYLDGGYGGYGGLTVWDYVRNPSPGLSMYLPELNTDGTAPDPVEGPVNQLEWSPEFRRHLARIAHEFDTGFHFDHGPRLRERRIESRPVTLTEEDTTRNGNVSQWVREMCGRMWRKMNIWGQLPTTAESGWNTTELEKIRALMQQFCGVCTPGYVRRIMKRHNHLIWKEKLMHGVRFHPDTSFAPYGAIDIPGARQVGEWLASYDLRNFELAADYFHDDESGLGYLDSVYLHVPDSPSFPTQTGDYGAQKRALGQFWLDNYHTLAQSNQIRFLSDRPAALRKLLAYRRFCEMQILALRHDSNFSDSASNAKMSLSKVTARRFLELDPNPMVTKWGDGAKTGWREGYLFYNKVDGSLRRDAIPYSDDDVSTYPEGATTEGDSRTGTFVTVLLESDMDSSDPEVTGRHRAWTDEAIWVARFNLWLPTPTA